MTRALGDRFVGHDGLVHQIDDRVLFAINAGSCGASGSTFNGTSGHRYLEDIPRTKEPITCFRCLTYKSGS